MNIGDKVKYPGDAPQDLRGIVFEVHKLDDNVNGQLLGLRTQCDDRTMVYCAAYAHEVELVTDAEIVDQPGVLP